MALKAIETRYKGYRFRSRLEARWAIYLDTVGLRWEYEPEGFHLEDGTWYLPDFWLPDVGSWAEVKPELLSASEWQRCALLVKGSGHPCVLLIGTPEAQAYGRVEPMHGDGHIHGVDGWSLPTDLPDGIGLCDVFVDASYVHERRFYACTGGSGAFDPGILEAVQAARSARFEHGESGGGR